MFTRNVYLKKKWHGVHNQINELMYGANTLVAIATGLVFLNTLLRIALYNYMHLLSLL